MKNIPYFLPVVDILVPQYVQIMEVWGGGTGVEWWVGGRGGVGVRKADVQNVWRSKPTIQKPRTCLILTWVEEWQDWLAMTRSVTLQ